jgi:pilus assembly protein CpaE
MNPLSIALVISDQDLWNEVQLCLRGSPARVVLQQPSVGDWSLFVEQLERLRPDVLLFDITRSLRSLEEAVRSLKALAAPPMVVALHSSADPETILAAIRAGANEYLYPPLEAGLKKALERVSSEQAKRQARPRPRARTLGFLSSKGGCGATTVACHVSLELQRVTGQDILLADFDLDAGIIGFLMKVKTPYTLLDAVQNVHRLDLSYWKALISDGRVSLEVIPAPCAAALRQAVEPEPYRHVLSFVRSAYDWVVLDLGRNLNPLSLNLLEEIDEVFLVATLDLPALHQAKLVTQMLLDYGFSQNRLHLVLNRMPKRSDLAPDEVERVLGVPVYATLPNNYPELFEAYAHGNLLPQNSELGQQFNRLTVRIAGVQAPKSKSRLTLSL